MTEHRYAVVGIDVGGSHTAAMVASRDGSVLGRGVAGGANAWSSGSDRRETILAAVHQATAGVDGRAIGGGVVGLAGIRDRDDALRDVRHVWTELGIGGVPAVVADYVAAFSAGTPARSGLVLCAGTGAVAAFVSEGDVVDQADGGGWLLGDEGSAVWLGIEALRHVLKTLDGRTDGSGLSEAVVASIGAPGRAAPELRHGIFALAYDRPPAELGRLAPLVVRAAEAGDAAAGVIVDGAAERLVASLRATARLGNAGVCVLAGSLLTKVDAVSVRVRERIRDWRPDLRVVIGRDGAAGAAALALAANTGAGVDAEVHRRLCQGE